MVNGTGGIMQKAQAQALNKQVSTRQAQGGWRTRSLVTSSPGVKSLYEIYLETQGSGTRGCAGALMQALWVKKFQGQALSYILVMQKTDLWV